LTGFDTVPGGGVIYGTNVDVVVVAIVFILFFEYFLPPPVDTFPEAFFSYPAPSHVV
jgi:hypothetical protein